ncbi:MAG: homocysteine S-methyltransferase family protein, partial [Clostridiales bacterium]|nr:homocysteine S-methyltransferase family protein [Clostridiales bacterium]
LMQLLEPYGDMTEEEAEEIFSEQIGAGMEEHPDAIYVQTFMDVELAKIAARVARRYDVPLFCSMTFEPVGKTMMGQSVDDVIAGMSEFSPDAIGLNCSLGPETALPIIEQFKEKTNIPLIFKPNAGKPKPPVGGVSQSDFDAETFAKDVMEAARRGVKYVGGCCGSDPTYIRKLKELLDKER